jgi:nitroreductase
MCRFEEPASKVLDEIIRMRRTHRVFGPGIPPEYEVETVIEAGLSAPFAAAAAGSGKEYFRQFFVFRRDSRKFGEISGVLMKKVLEMTADLEQAMERDPDLQEKAGLFMKRLKAIREMGIIPGIGTAPYYIIIGEKAGFPPVMQQSIAHCLENMWLKATVLNLGFQLVSLTGQMGSDPDFCRILGLPPSKFEMNGCALGYPAEDLPPSVRPPADMVTRWME